MPVAKKQLMKFIMTVARDTRYRIPAVAFIFEAAARSIFWAGVKDWLCHEK